MLPLWPWYIDSIYPPNCICLPDTFCLNTCHIYYVLFPSSGTTKGWKERKVESGTDRPVALGIVTSPTGHFPQQCLPSFLCPWDWLLKSSHPVWPQPQPPTPVEPWSARCSCLNIIVWVGMIQGRLGRKEGINSLAITATASSVYFTWLWDYAIQVQITPEKDGPPHSSHKRKLKSIAFQSGCGHSALDQRDSSCAVVESHPSLCVRC